jgi:TonB family protein
MCTRRTVETLRRIVPLVTTTMLLTLAPSACGGRERGVGPGRLAVPADTAELAATTVPRMLNPEPPFRYPVELWAQKVQGNVTLRLHVDSAGRVRPESTTVVASSGHPAFDSAAVRGSTALTFAPALRHGRPVGRSIRFPVHFRHPDASPFDTRDQHATPSRP